MSGRFQAKGGRNLSGHMPNYDVREIVAAADCAFVPRPILAFPHLDDAPEKCFRLLEITLRAQVVREAVHAAGQRACGHKWAVLLDADDQGLVCPRSRQCREDG